ncbi:hypothetical protein BDZ97DRAFT_1900968 [Flammula alnicola]|nr:hypothetical protein BDZ97DRAFT_1900968 [Flammula alnicola]
MSTPSTEDENAFTIAAYMRVVSIAIAAYDYLETQPTAWRFYKEHWQSRRLTCVSVSFAEDGIFQVGFFYSHFTDKSCRQFYLLPPAFKVLSDVSKCLVKTCRTFNLSRRSKGVGWLLLSVYTAACILQWVSTLYQRTRKSCRPFNQATQLGAYVFYAVAIVYDTLTTSMSIFYLLKYKLNTTNSM